MNSSVLPKQFPFALIGIWLAFLISVSTSTVAHSGPTSRQLIEAKPHVIFLVHGLGGDENTFEDLAPLLTENYRAFNVRVKALSYPSFGGTKAISSIQATKIAKIINSQMISFLFEEGERDRKNEKFQFQFPVDQESSYSIIAHSQGGLVVLSYLNSCLSKPVDTKSAGNENINCPYNDGLNELMWASGGLAKLDYDQLLQNRNQKQKLKSPANLANFISFGSPFWGAPLANNLQDFDWFTKIKGFVLPVSQMENLAVGGIVSSMQRIFMIDRKSFGQEDAWSTDATWKSHYPPQLRVYNVAGVVRDISATARSPLESLYNMTTKKYEHDMVVAIPESRIDFIYNIENSNPEKATLRGRTHMGTTFLPISLPHTSFAGEPGLVAINRSNYRQHPSFAILANIFNQYLTGQEFVLDPRVRSRLTENLSNFTSEIKLVLPPGYRRGFRVRFADVQVTPEQPQAFASVKLSSSPLFPTQGYNQNAIQLKKNYYQTYYHIGKFAGSHSFDPQNQNSVQGSNSQPGYRLNYKIDVIGYETKEFFTYALPSFETYSEVYLKPYLPIQPIGISPLADPIYEWVQNSNLRNSDCSVGLVGQHSVDENARGDFILHKGRATHEYQNNGEIYANFRDRESSDFLAAGEPVEILGRFSSLDQYGNFHSLQNCATRETVTGDAYCNGQYFDRYLVTSPKIRKMDGIKNFADIQPGKGLRWMDVMDIDILKNYKYYERSYSTGSIQEPSAAGDHCLKDQERALYFPAVRNNKIYYE